MKQVLQHARTGAISVAEVPEPKLLPGCVLVRIAASLVSAGTERASSEFASKNLLQKAQARPDLVRDVLNKVRRDGLIAAISTVQSRLDQPSALGYSSAGTVMAVSEGVTGLIAGDRVACAGAGYAVHAEVCSIPRLLVAKIPAGPDGSEVSFDDAAFTTVGAVALHGVRTAEVRVGDVVAVIGLGLLGQLTVQLLKAAGCRVLGMDIVEDRSQLALRMGADAVSSSEAGFRDLCLQHSNGHGADAVLITAETASSGPVNLAGELARDRAVVVAVGTVGMDIERKQFYAKELDFRLSRSYGPGRYDSVFEQKGRDYPIGYVRWTETRNMEAFLQLLAQPKLDLEPLITHRFPVDRARDAYELITGKTNEQFLGVLITYPEQISEPADRRPGLELVVHGSKPGSRGSSAVSIGLLGPGNFAMSTLLPAIKGISGIALAGVCANNGANARHAAEKFGFRYCATDEDEILSDPAVNTVVIATRHHLHARQVLAAIAAGKHVFCEKPLCLREDELSEISQAYSGSARGALLMVGFNRRFAPMVTRMKSFLDEIHEPLAMSYRVNAGFVEPDHWVNDPEEGGGRLLGEVCHFVDLLTFLSGSSPIRVQAQGLADSGRYSGDNLVVSLQFENGSQGTISYFANGDRTYSKERLEVFGGGAVVVLEDFRRLELVRNGRRQVSHSRLRQNKGHRAEWEAFAQAIRSGGESPVPFEDIIASTLATLRAAESLASGRLISVDVPACFTSASIRRRSES